MIQSMELSSLTPPRVGSQNGDAYGCLQICAVLPVCQTTQPRWFDLEVNSSMLNWITLWIPLTELVKGGAIATRTLQQPAAPCLTNSRQDTRKKHPWQGNGVPTNPIDIFMNAHTGQRTCHSHVCFKLAENTNQKRHRCFCCWTWRTLPRSYYIAVSSSKTQYMCIILLRRLQHVDTTKNKLVGIRTIYGHA